MFIHSFINSSSYYFMLNHSSLVPIHPPLRGHQISSIHQNIGPELAPQGPKEIGRPKVRATDRQKGTRERAR